MGTGAFFTALKQTVSEHREEIAPLKGLKDRPMIKPSGMDDATELRKSAKKGKRGFRGKVTPRVGDPALPEGTFMAAGSLLYCLNDPTE